MDHDIRAIKKAASLIFLKNPQVCLVAIDDDQQSLIVGVLTEEARKDIPSSFMGISIKTVVRQIFSAGGDHEPK